MLELDFVYYCNTSLIKNPMKKLFIFLWLIISHTIVHSQVAINTNTPDPSAALDITSFSKGLLTPRMTAAQMNAITNPAVGLIVFQTDSTAGLYYFNGVAWTTGIMAAGALEGNTPYFDGTKWVLNSGNLYNNGSYVGVGILPTEKFDVQGKFQVNAEGNIVKLNNVPTSFPSTQGLSNSFLQNDGGGNLAWATPVTKTWVITDQKLIGTNGGSAIAGVWQTRTLNTVISSPTATELSLNANFFTLMPGTYAIEAYAPGYRCSNHQARLFNITYSIVTAIGTNEYSGSSGDTQSKSLVTAVVSVSTPTSFRLEHRCSLSAASSGFGTANGFSGSAEIYSMVKVTKL
jgi:hypothetical protein